MQYLKLIKINITPQPTATGSGAQIYLKLIKLATILFYLKIKKFNINKF